MDLFQGNSFGGYTTITREHFVTGSNEEIDESDITERCDGMAVDGLVLNSSYFHDASLEFEPLSCQSAANGAPTSEIRTSQSSEPSNSERTLEKWEYLLRTRPRDPMYAIAT